MTIYYRDGYEGQLAQAARFVVPESLRPRKNIDTEFIHLSTDGVMRFKRGYAWDYGSGPTLDATWMPGHKKAKAPTLVHDGFCQLIRNGYMNAVDDARKHADRLMYDMLLERKMWKLRARLWYRGVRAGAKLKKQKPKPILEAP